MAKGEETGGINPPQPQAANMRKLVRAGAAVVTHCVTLCVILRLNSVKNTNFGEDNKKLFSMH